MNPPKRIQIAGGGLAGLALGIGLRRQSVPVTIWEAAGYPRHRVCGEFISGLGQRTLERMGLSDLLIRAGAIPAETVALYSMRAVSTPCRLPEAALCLSRHIMDELLAREFQRLGGELRENERWRGSDFGEGLVRATGRRAQPVADGWRWFGLKAHARNVPLNADLEMHFAPGGYTGICRLKDGEVNVCGLFRRRAGMDDSARNGQEILRGVPGSVLRERLANAEWIDGSFCAVAGLSLQPQRAAAHGDCCVGDALTMIPPVTGNGMSMAFESAEMAIEPLAAYSRGKIEWAGAARAVASACDERFARRLAWAGRLQRMLFAPGVREALFFLAPRNRWLWRRLFEHTR